MANHYKNIVVAVDGSKEAEYAFRKSIDVAKRNVRCNVKLSKRYRYSFFCCNRSI